MTTRSVTECKHGIAASPIGSIVLTTGLDDDSKWLDFDYPQPIFDSTRFHVGGRGVSLRVRGLDQQTDGAS